MSDVRDQMDLALVEAWSLVRREPTPPQPGPDEPDDEALLRYLDGNLPSREREQLRQTLERSAWCRERLAILREALHDGHDGDLSSAPPRAAAPARISFVWARDGLRYLWGNLAPRTLVAVPVATRGSVPDGLEETAFFDFAHRFAGLDVVIQVERVPDDRLDVQLLFQGTPDQLSHLRVNLANREGSLLDSQPVERGGARFAALTPTPHRISISAAQQELGSILLDVFPV
jgi:anti-sigma factor RsiW